MTRLERSIAFVLQAGVALSSTLLALGVVLRLANLVPVEADQLLRIGILILLCTPVMRVVISTVEYALARDWKFATLTAIVLVELMASAVAALFFNERL